jgi:hypothetical protein
LFVEEDGSVIIRDAWGSEVYMRGGNINISCAGTVYTQPGESIVQMAGKDAIIKAKNSIDLSSTDKDVRIKAEGNMHLYSKDGGMLLETESSGGSTHGFSEGAEGEDVNSRGITLKAQTSRVFLWGDTVHLSAVRDVILEATGRILNLASNFLSFCSRTIVANDSGSDGLLIGSGSSRLVGGNVGIHGTSGANVTRGSEVMVPLQWVDAQDIATPLQRNMEAQADVFDEDYLAEYAPGDRDPIKFTFRTGTQYGTDKASEVDPDASDFFMYQTPWQRLVENGSDLIQGSSDTWPENAVNDTYPYPGREKYDGSAYITLGQETNVESDGQVKDRQTLQDTSGPLTPTSLNGWTVLKR